MTILSLQFSNPNGRFSGKTERSYVLDDLCCSGVTSTLSSFMGHLETSLYYVSSYLGLHYFSYIHLFIH